VVLTATRIAETPLEVLPSAGQRGILTHIAMHPQVHPAYNEPLVLEWRGALDADRLELVLGVLMQRHESLRAALAPDGEHWIIAPCGLLGLERIDLSAFDNGLATAKAQEWLSSAAQAPFDLRSAPLIRASLVTIAADRHWLVLIAHHAIIDGVSYGVLFDELMGLYQALGGGGAFAPPRPLALAEANARQSRPRPADQRYWLERLATPVPYLALPSDRPFPPQRSYAAHRVGRRAPETLASRLSAFCRSQGVTPFHACLCAYRLLLHRSCGQGASVIGVPVAIHTLQRGETYVGFGVNVLAISGSTAGSASFATLVQATRDDFLDALKHKGLPLDELIGALGQPRDSSRPALVTVLFNYEAIGSHAGPGYRVQPRVPAMALGKYELALDVLAAEEGIEVCLTAAADLFDRASAERLLARYLHLFEQLLEHPERALAEQSALLPEERERLGQYKAMAISEDCLHRRFARAVSSDPEAPAIRHDDRTISYRELDTRANRLARQLLAAGARPCDRIGLCLPRTPDLVAAMLAVLKCGAAYVPLDPAYPSARLDALVAAADAALVVCADPTLGTGWPQRRTLGLDALDAASDDTDLPLDLPVDPGQPAYLIFTSGSTGAPKGVTIDHRAAVSFLDWAADEMPASARAGVLACSSICFDLSVFELFLPLCTGGKVILVDNALALAELANTDDIRLINTVPSAMAELVRLAALPAGLEIVNLAGEALDAGLVQAVQAQRPSVTLYNLYGPSEATTYATLLRMPPGFSGAVTIGHPVPGTRLYLLDEDLQPVPPGTKGMIYLAGNSLAQGYFGRPAATAEVFLPDPHAPEPGQRMYRTGDLGRLLPDPHAPGGSQISYLGRQDGQLKLRGHRIELGEIQSHLLAVPGVGQAAVLAVGAGAEGQIIGFFTSASESQGLELLRRRIAAALTAALPGYMLPARLIGLETLPLTPNGKTDMARLRTLAGDDEAQPRVGSASPCTPTQQRMAAIWGRHLGLPTVAADADFFALGGHSLLAIRILHDINCELDCHLRPSDLLQHPTIRTLAARLEQQAEPPPARFQAAITAIGTGQTP
jgi:amino acid adenylation domain-containing protein